MTPLRIAIVGRDPRLRALAAAAFDEAPAGWDVTLHEAPPDGSDVTVDLSGNLSGAGVIPFDPTAPHRTVSAIASRTAARNGPIGVWSPCAGAGSTSIAVHLAACLAEAGPCTLVDLDARRGVGVRLGCPPLDPDVSDPALRARPVIGGFRLIEGDMPRADGGRVIVDGPAEAVRAAGCAKHVIVLPSGRTGVERSVETVRDLDEPCALIVNRTGWGGELTKAAIGRAIGRRIALELPCSPGLRDAEDRRELLSSPLSLWLYRVRRLARAL